MSNFEPQTHLDELSYLKSLGFPTNPLNSTANSLQEIWDRAKELETQKNALNYPIDGLVIKLNQNDVTEKLGIIGKTPRAWAAIKFKAEEVSTKLLDVTWQVGRTGKITPVAVLEPVDLAGTTVKRATLHNYKEFQESALQKGDVLIIRKAGEIIPEVLQILVNLRDLNKPQALFSAPETCTSCGQKVSLSNTGVDLLCLNTQNCPDQILERLSYYTQRNIAGITGLSDKIIARFRKDFGTSDIPDLYDLPYDKIEKMEGFGEKSAINIQKSVEKARKVPAHKFLAGLGIDGIGPEISKLIIKKILQKPDSTGKSNS